MLIVFLILAITFRGFLSIQESEYYQEIHKIWPSLRIPDPLLSQIDNATETSHFTSFSSFNSTISSDHRNATELASGSKTVVFPSPICVSIPMAPCVIIQIFWRNSTAKAFGLRIPIHRIRSFPRPREREMPYAELLKMSPT